MDLKTIHDELETLRVKGNSILDSISGNRIPPEKRVELDRISERISELMQQEKDTEYLDQKKKDYGDIENHLTAPQYRIPRGVGNSPDETKAALMQAGWEVKGGLIHAPTTKGLQAIWPQEVLFADAPEEDVNARQYFKSVRATFQPEYRSTFLKWVALAIQVKSENRAFSMLSGVEQKALSEGSDVGGGYLVPPDVQAEVLARIPMESVMRPLCRVIPTSRDLVRFPRVQPAAGTTNGSIYSSGFIGSWAGETPAFVDTDAQFGTFEITIKKIRTATRVSNDLVADSVFPFLSFLGTDGAKNMALVEDQGFINGLGSSLQPLGLLQSGLTTVNISGTTNYTISNTTSNLGSAPLIMNVQAQLPMQYQANAIWLTHRLNKNHIRQLVDGYGRFIWAPGFAEDQTELLGKKVHVSDFVPLDGTQNNLAIAYFDPSDYIIATRAAISITILRERFADTDQTGIILWERVGGGLWNTDSGRVGICN